MSIRISPRCGRRTCCCRGSGQNERFDVLHEMFGQHHVTQGFKDVYDSLRRHDGRAIACDGETEVDFHDGRHRIAFHTRISDQTGVRLALPRSSWPNAALLPYNLYMPGLHDVSVYWLVGILLFYWIYRTFLLGYPKFRVDEALDLDNPDTLRIISALSNALVCPKNQIEPIHDGKNFYPAQLEAIRNSRHSVNIEVYTFFPEEIGREFAAALCERAVAGVQVRLRL